VKRSFFASLRFRLVLLVLVSVVPVVSLLFLQGLAARQDAAEHAKADALLLARAVSAQQTRFVWEARHVLDVLARLPELRAKDPRRCGDLFASLLEQYPGYSGFALARPDGTVICSAPPASGTVSFADRAWFQDVLQTRDFVLGDYQIGRLSGRPVVIAAHPIFDAAGQTQAVVTVGLDLNWLGQLLAEVSLSSGATLTVIDRAGTILAQYPDGQRWIGQSVPDVAIIQDVLAHQGEGTAEAAGVDGVDRLFAFTPLGDAIQTDAHVFVGIPVETAFAGANRIMARNLTLLAMLTVLGLLVAWMGVGPLVLRQVRALTSATQRLAAGDLSARAGPTVGVAELGQLASAFDEMAEALEQRTKQLGESETRFRILVEQTPAITYVAALDELSGTLYISPQIQDLLGYSPAEWLADPQIWLKQVHPDDREQTLAALGRCRASGEPFHCEYRLFARNGRLRWFYDAAELVRDSAGQPLFLQGLMLDITERKQADDALRDSEQTLRTLVNANPESLFLIDTQGTILMANETFARRLGKSAPEIVGTCIYDLVPADTAEARRKRIDEVIHSGRPARFEDTRGGRTIDNYIHPILDAEGQVAKLALLGVDITERTRTEEALRVYALRLERSNRELQDFAYVASHDLQEPLRKVQAFGDRLVAKYREVLGAEGRDYLDRMHSAAGRMQTMINDLLAYSRVTTKVQPFQPVDLARVAREVVSDLETRIVQTHGTVELGNLPTLEADPTQMRQLLQNLIANALKFGRPDVPPLVKVYGQPLPGAPGGEFVQIMVEDNGIGFDEKYLDRLFQPFQRLHSREEYEGTGIGLAICRKIVERHGGSITVQSAPGQGTTFIATLPLKQPKGENPE